MRRSVFAAALCAALFSSAAFAADIEFHKTLTVTGPATLTLCDNSGIVEITGVDGNQISLAAKVHKSNWHAFGNAEEMKRVADHPPIQQTGNAVTVGDSTTCGGTTLENIAIDYQISVPRLAKIHVRLSDGALHITSIGGPVQAAVVNGDITASGVGPDSRLGTNNGTVDVHGASGPLLAESGNGNVSLSDSNGAKARLGTNHGTITVTHLIGSLEASTMNGDLFLGGTPTGGWKARTNNGAVHFDATPGAKFDIDAETGNGTIDSSLPAPLAGHVTSGSLRGPVNGGGPEVQLYTGNGSITLR